MSPLIWWVMRRAVARDSRGSGLGRSHGSQGHYLGHALLDLPLLLRRHRDMKMNRAAALFSRHGYRPPRSGAFLLGLGGACRPASCICREMEGFCSMCFPTVRLSVEGRSS